MYLIIDKVIVHIKEKNGSKCLVFYSTDENKKILKKYTELWDGIENKIMPINGGKEGEYGKDFVKIKFDVLTLNKLLKLQMLTIVVRFVFEENGKFYPQIYLDECLYEV